MKASFFHDHVFKKFDGKYYSEGKLTDKTWQRYLSFYDNLTVVARYVDSVVEDVETGHNETSNPNISFDCINKISVIDRVNSSRIDRLIERNIIDSDLVVCRLPSFLGYRAFSLAKKLNKKTLLEVVGCPFDSYCTHGTFIGKILAPIEYFKMRYAVSSSKYTIYVTDHFLQKRYPTNGFSIGASNVELPEFDSVVTLKQKKTEELFIIKFIGSLNAKYKGLTDLICALNLLKEYNFQLHILGSGDRNQYITLAKSLGIENKLVFFDSIQGGQGVLSWLLSGDLYVQPSHTEGLPRSLIEAMSLGLPCIGTNVGGIPELLDATVITEPKSPEALSCLIQKMLCDNDFRLLQGCKNQAKSKDYGFSTLQERRYDFIRQVFKG